MTTKLEFTNRLKKLRENFNGLLKFKFLNPSEITMVKQVFKDFYIYEHKSNGEYKKIIVSDIEIVPVFDVLYLKSSYQDRTINHKDVLGSLYGLGIKRDVFGDITITESFIYIEADLIMTTYIKTLNQIKRDFVYFEVVDSIPEASNAYEEIQIFIDSLRIDAIISKAFNINREDVKIMIKQEKVKNNYVMIQKHTMLCSICDIISVRGFGRIRLLEVMGQSKKNKIRLKCELIR